MSSTAYAGSWSTLPVQLTDWVFDVIHSLGHEKMTPVQAATIPLFMKNKDVVVEAVTGSGKTLAFVLPVLERLIRRETKHRRNEIGALIISPTRELAAQIHSVFSLFLSSQPVINSEGSEEGIKQYPEPLLLVSSDKSSPAQDVERFLSTGADIVIGTPGRVEEFLLGKGRELVSVKEMEVLVLDEADRLLDLGFHATLMKIINHLPKQRRTGLFSATMTDVDTVSELVKAGLRNPARVIVKVQSKKNHGSDIQKGSIIEERRIPASLRNYYIPCSAAEKLVQLVHIISHELSQRKSSQIIIYFATCACVDYFYRILPFLLPPAANLHSLHGHLPPSARTKTLKSFATSIATPSSPSILLATDVAARGLDIPDVDVVIQFDPPSDTKAFSHRCGRTARAGKAGTAWVLLAGREVEYVDFLTVRKIPIVEHVAFSGSDSEAATDEITPLSYLSRIRETVSADRALHDLAMKAFVSFVRAYTKHEASYIFRIKDLDLVGVATCFGLLRLPKMPEFKNVDKQGWTDANIDWADYAYLDKIQEKKRLAAKDSQPATGQEERKIRRVKKVEANAPWSEHVVKKELKERRKDQKVKKKQWLKAGGQETADMDAGAGEKRIRADSVNSSDDDWDEIAREERLAKKVKKGQITQHEFDQEFADL